LKMNEEGSRKMGEYREIITKAVVAKGRKFTQSNHTISPAHSPTSILGCWIINHKYNASFSIFRNQPHVASSPSLPGQSAEAGAPSNRAAADV
jgi:hypothetical protein